MIWAASCQISNVNRHCLWPNFNWESILVCLTRLKPDDVLFFLLKKPSPAGLIRFTVGWRPGSSVDILRSTVENVFVLFFPPKFLGTWWIVTTSFQFHLGEQFHCGTVSSVSPSVLHTQSKTDVFLPSVSSSSWLTSAGCSGPVSYSGPSLVRGQHFDSGWRLAPVRPQNCYWDLFWFIRDNIFVPPSFFSNPNPFSVTHLFLSKTKKEKNQIGRK